MMIFIVQELKLFAVTQLSILPPSLPESQPADHPTICPHGIQTTMG
jgi:hypothetical protein